MKIEWKQRTSLKIRTSAYVKYLFLTLLILIPIISVSILNPSYSGETKTDQKSKNGNLEDLYGDNVNIEEKNGITTITPKASDYYKTHVHHENSSDRIDHSFSSGNFESTGWIPDYTFGGESSGMGRIEIDPYQGGNCLFLEGETQKQDLQVASVPELPEDMAVRSDNLWDEENHNFGGGTLKVHFYPNNIKTVVEWTTQNIGGVPVPVPSMIYVNTFYIYVRTDSEATFNDPVYSYSVSEYQECEEQTLEIGMHDYDIVDYFEISLRAFLWDSSNWVAIDYAKFDSYSISVEEKMDNNPENDNGDNIDFTTNLHDPYGIPSSYDQELTIDFTSRENIDLDQNSVDVYVNPDVELSDTIPDLLYKVVPGQIDISCESFPATFVSGNTFTCTIPSETYIDGDVGYRIRFENNNGGDFWTPSFSFHTYDNEPPDIDPNSIEYENTPEYQNGMDVNYSMHDEGGAHLKHAKLYYSPTTDFDTLDIQQIESNPSNNYVIDEVVPDEEGIYPDDWSSTFSITSDGLKVKKVGEEPMHFCIIAEDRAGNKLKTDDYEFRPIDTIAPEVSFRKKSFREVDDFGSSPTTRWVSDLGYPLNVTWLIKEPTQAAGIDTIKIGITGNESLENLVDANNTDEFSGEIVKTLSYSGSNRETPELNDPLIDYITGKWYQICIFANDTWGNSFFEYTNLYIEDVRAPDIIEGENNTRNPNFDEDIVFSFSAWEPKEAKGVDNSTIEFKYLIVEENEDPIPDYFNFSLNANPLVNTSYNYELDKESWRHNITYFIDESQFDFGDIIYYEFNVDDNGENQFSTTEYRDPEKTPEEAGLRMLIIEDYIDPSLDICEYDQIDNNFTTISSYFDCSIKATIEDQDEDGGSGLKNIKLYYTYGEGFIAWRFNRTWPSITQYSYNEGTETYKFIISEESYTIDEDNPDNSIIYFVLYVDDHAGNIIQWKRNITIYDSIKPNVVDFDYDSVDIHDTYVPTLTPTFYFELDRNAYMYYLIDGAQAESATSEISSFSVDLEFSEQGEHNLKVYYNDFSWERNIIIDTIAPNQVTEVVAKQKGANHYLQWEKPEGLNQEEEIEYIIYRGQKENFTATQDTYIGETTNTEFEYHFDVSGTFYYKVKAVDAAKNSAPVSPVSNKITSVATTDIGLTVGIVLGVVSALLMGYYGMKRYQKFYGIQDGKLALKQRLKFRKKSDFSKASKGDMKKELKTETTNEQMKAKKTVSDEPPSDRVDELGEEEFESEQSNSEGWEEESEGNDTGWD